jgi:hypothetical protein
MFGDSESKALRDSIRKSFIHLRRKRVTLGGLAHRRIIRATGNFNLPPCGSFFIACIVAASRLA